MTPPVEALRDILERAGWTGPGADAVRFTGADPVLPTNFLMGTAGAAAIAAVGLGVAEWWRLRAGTAQDVSVDLRAAAMALRGNTFLAVDGGPPPDLWGGISGYYETADGRWIQFHCNFPHHRDGVLAVLGCGDDRAEVAAAVADWNGQDLEDALAAAGMCATMARTAGEWRAHPQAEAVAGLPLLEIEKIADGPPQPPPAGERPLSGLRVLDLTRVLAGPVAGRALAEHGAEVMRVSGPGLPFIPPLVMETGHGKLAAEVDLKTEAGRETLRGLLGRADVFSQAYRHGALAGRGFSPAEVAEIRPGIVYLDLCAWGRRGPWRDRRGFDTLVQTATGIAMEQGADGRPSHLPGSPLDYVSGYLGAFGVLVALGRRAREGGSYLVRLSLARTGRWIDGLGRVDGPDARGLPTPGLADVADLTTESDTPFGRLTHLAPVVGLSETPPRWERPAAPLASHPPVWPG